MWQWPDLVAHHARVMAHPGIAEYAKGPQRLPRNMPSSPAPPPQQQPQA